jgi:hypothetical protein
MTDLNYPAVAVSAVVAFMLSSVYYIPFGRQLAELSDAYADPGRPPAWKLGVELVRNLVLVAVLAGFTEQIDIDGWADAVVLGLASWVGFPLVLWTGAVVWERVPWKLAAIHAGDWLVKLLVVAVIVGVWR